MNIPRKMNIFGVNYTIKVVDLTKVGDDLAGLHVPEPPTILIEKSIKGRELVETFWHEVFHAVIHITGVDQALQPELEEVIVTNLSRQVSLFYVKKK